jgi:hypothetical protein
MLIAGSRNDWPYDSFQLAHGELVFLDFSQFLPRIEQVVTPDFSHLAAFPVRVIDRLV